MVAKAHPGRAAALPCAGKDGLPADAAAAKRFTESLKVEQGGQPFKLLPGGETHLGHCGAQCVRGDNGMRLKN